MYLSFYQSEPVSTIDLSLNETCLKEGSTVSILCEIRGFPRPNVEFRQNDAEITPGIGAFKNVVLELYNQVRNLNLASHMHNILLVSLTT